ncbi:MAG: hypothetical protein MH252_02205 [Thermosynechococcaceae cyanobacterium MS004]|nr:hypothetical protein [Thermosynechococcaceae cyanobacterium MS004]
MKQTAALRSPFDESAIGFQRCVLWHPSWHPSLGAHPPSLSRTEDFDAVRIGIFAPEEAMSTEFSTVLSKVALHCDELYMRLYRLIRNATSQLDQ